MSIPPPSVCAQCGRPLTGTDATAGCPSCLAAGVAAGPSPTPRDHHPPPPTAHGTARYHHYEVLCREDGAPFELGRGSMGVTYKAVDVNLRVPVALKVIDADYARHPRARELFLREARSAARLRHPNVATVYHFGALDPAPVAAGAPVSEDPAGAACFYAMEFVDGETLDARVRRAGPLPVGDVLEIALQIARALVAAEDRGLIHRDLKPSNVMLAADGRREQTWVKVIDFGLAKAMEAGEQEGIESSAEGPLTHGGFVGTPGYASPEQFELAELDVRSDVYSLGATLWFALTAEMPYQGNSLVEIYDRQTHRPLPVARLLETHAPPALVELLTAMLSPDPSVRPASARELRAALEACLAPGPAAPPRGPRRWLVPAVAAGAVAALVAGAILTPGPAVPSRPPAAAPTAPEKSLAVLPFQSLSADPSGEFFAAGMQDEVLTDLAKVADLKVISRGSVMQYRPGEPRDLHAIATQLGVTYVVEGSVQQAGSRVRVNAQLIDTRTNAQQWAEHYDRSLDDVFTLQSDIARAIAGQLQARISPAEHAAMAEAPTRDVLAFQLYQQALELDDHVTAPNARAALLQAVGVLGQALARDPKFVPAWCLLSEVHMDLYWNNFDHTTARRDLARVAADEAVRLQPDASETHVALAAYDYYALRDYEGALAELTPVLHREPNNSAALANAGAVHRRLGRWEEAIREWERSALVDPRHLDPIQALAETYAALGRYPDAARAYNRALDISHGNVEIRECLAMLPFCERADLGSLRALHAAILAGEPAAVPASAYTRLYAALAEGDRAAATAALETLPAEGWQDMNGLNMPRDWFVAVAARAAGDAPGAEKAFQAARAQAEALTRDQPDFAQAWSALGLIDAGLGRKEEAVGEARRGCELLPVSRDVWDAPTLLADLAEVYAWNGEKGQAIERLTEAARSPSSAVAGGLSYGGLKCDPRWQALRGEPGFQALVAARAPKP